MAFKGKHPVKSRIVIYDKPTDQINHINYLEWIISILRSYFNFLETKQSKFNHMRGPIRGLLNTKTGRETPIKFYRTMVVPTLTQL
jgi:hypothetical protein